jgi:hypothetical protein
VCVCVCVSVCECVCVRVRLDVCECVLRVHVCMWAACVLTVSESHPSDAAAWN